MCPTCDVTEERCILCVGKVCLDIIHMVDQYPEEDSDKRSTDHWWHRGGNASNMCTVLSTLGQKCEYMGTMADSHGIKFIEDSFKSEGILTDHVIHYKGYPTPTSTVLLNTKRGTRTIVHGTKGLPELKHKDFLQIDLTAHFYKWIHFEGRPCIGEMRKMLHHIAEYNKTVHCTRLRIQTSLEIEKHREGIETLISLVDVVFISKDFAEHHGLKSKEETLRVYTKLCRQQSTLICPWGEDGAIAGTTDGQTHTSSIYPPDRVIDTLGAGDTFIAAVIQCLSQNVPLREAVRFGCRVAGAKCGVPGFRGLGDKIRTLKSANLTDMS